MKRLPPPTAHARQTRRSSGVAPSPRLHTYADLLGAGESSGMTLLSNIVLHPIIVMTSCAPPFGQTKKDPAKSLVAMATFPRSSSRREGWGNSSRSSAPRWTWRPLITGETPSWPATSSLGYRNTGRLLQKVKQRRNYKMVASRSVFHSSLLSFFLSFFLFVVCLSVSLLSFFLSVLFSFFI